MEKMKNNTKYTLPEQTLKLLEAGRYKDCFTLLRRRLTENPIQGWLNKLTNSERTYRYMLEYFAKGLEDPGREDMIASIRYDLFDIAQRIDKESATTDSPEIYFSVLRMCRLRPVDISNSISKIIQFKAMSDLALSAGHYPESVMAQIDAEEEKVFNALWTADDLHSDSYKVVTNAVKEGSVPYTTASLCIAAVGLSLMRYYSRDAMLMLISLATSDDFKISAKSLSTLVIASSRWKEVVTDDKKVMEALEVLMDVDGMPKKIQSVIKTAIRTRDTDRVSRKMQREVIPGLMQFGPDILQKLKKSSEEASFTDLEGNPEWEELLRNTGLEDKLRELTEMQSDGADVMMVAFSNLKGFPFFRQVRNWFMPFTVEHPMLRSLHSVDDNVVTTMLEMSGMMCDSDKYSFVFSIASMPEMQRKMVVSQMQAQSEQMKEQLPELELMKAGMEFDDELTRYFRDLYRFHKLFPKRAEFFDPFAFPIDITGMPVLSRAMDTSETILPIAEFYFKRGYYSDALPLMQNIAQSSSESPHIWEKIGYCLEKQPNGNAEAIEAYMKAQLFNPDSTWISKRLGICFRRTGDYRNAVDYLKMAKPEDGSYDRSISLLVADTLAEGEKWEEALNELYRINYENPDDPEIIRRMARCAFRSGDLKNSEKWMMNIPNISLSEEDYRLMGHIAFLKNDIAEATRLYRLTVRPNDEKRIWKSQILSDIDILENLGASRKTLLLLLESIAYAIE